MWDAAGESDSAIAYYRRGTDRPPLNGGDETPGLVRYATWRSTCDTTILPTQSVVLSGATNNLSACVAHFNFLVDQTVYQEVRSFVQ